MFVFDLSDFFFMADGGPLRLPGSAVVVLSRSDGLECDENGGIKSDCCASFAASAADRANAGVAVISTVRNDDDDMDAGAVCVPRADGETADEDEEEEEGAEDEDGVECTDVETAGAGARRAGEVGADRADAANREAEPDDDEEDGGDDDGWPM